MKGPAGTARRAATAVAHSLLGRCRLEVLARRLGWTGVAITYHTIESSILEAHLDLLQSMFDLVGVDEALSRASQSGGTGPRLPATITFDDGKRSNLTDVAGALARRAVPATFFVTAEPARTGGMHWFDLAERIRRRLSEHEDPAPFCKQLDALAARTGAPTSEVANLRVLKRVASVERDAVLREMADSLGLDDVPENDDERSVSPEEAKELVRLGFTVGSHSSTHAIVTRESAERARAEIEESRKTLCEWIEQPVLHFAYPNGNASDETEKLTRSAGYEAAWTTRPMFLTRSENQHRLPRIELVPEYSEGDVSFKLLAGCLVALPNPDGTGRSYRRRRALAG
jgi:peptidoglycan/xylan/chitin deacetylase (PgdA/CDA1 family)